MKMTIALCFTLLSYSSFGQAPNQVEPTFFAKYLGFAQGLVTSVMGEEKANELYGIEKVVTVEAEQLQMPVIPVAKKEATSSESHTLGLSAKSKFRFLTEQQVQQLDYAFLQDLFMAVKKHKATDQELGIWMNTLVQGGSREGVYRAMVLDAHYANLENQPSTTNPNVMNFTTTFMEKFLNQKVKQESLQALNIYSLKRIVTEKTLEVFDEIKKKPADFYNWYAIMQGDLARQYGKTLKGKMAKEVDPLKHKHWAQEMPEQHLKSEVIIKLHTILNGLML